MNSVNGQRFTGKLTGEIFTQDNVLETATNGTLLDDDDDDRHWSIVLFLTSILHSVHNSLSASFGFVLS